MNHLLRSLALVSSLALPLAAAHADTFGGTATFTDTSTNSNFVNYTGTFAHSPFTFSGPVGTVYTDQLTITSHGGTFLPDAATDRISVTIDFTQPNAAVGSFSGTGTDSATFLGIINVNDIDWNSNSKTVHFTDGSSLMLTLPDFNFGGSFNPNSGVENLTFTVLTAPTPEPSTLALMGTGVLSAAGVLRRRFAR